MMRRLYSLLLLSVLPFFLIWLFSRMLLTKQYRRGFTERFGYVPRIDTDPDSESPISGPRVWVHTASVGEVLAAEPIIRSIASSRPDTVFILTANTDTGHAAAAEKMPFIMRIVQTPFDLPNCQRRFYSRIHPDLIIIMETELWPNMIYSAQIRNIPVIIANGRISDRSYPRYHRLRRFFFPILNGVTAFAMQSPIDAERMITLGAPPDRVSIAGNVKYDREHDLKPPPELQTLISDLGWTVNCRLLVAGSTHPGDEDQLFRVIKNLPQTGHHRFRMILAPRHLDRVDAIRARLTQAGIPFICRSDSARLRCGGVIDPASIRLVILDRMGELGRAYGLGHVAFIGGTFESVGGHNLLEPAAHAIPVLFGPHTFNFKDIAEKLIQSGGARRVTDADDLIRVLSMLFAEEAVRRDMGRRAFTVFESNRGAVDRHLAVILPLMPSVNHDDQTGSSGAISGD
ncbi:3-deoxy-D-manno-octulosonic acid transferase [bacterium]|nr:3-deoxy-D-manno-octulosonic acid transferase [candidate division CSSED10-310 bacterium]